MHVQSLGGSAVDMRALPIMGHPRFSWSSHLPGVTSLAGRLLMQGAVVSGHLKTQPVLCRRHLASSSVDGRG
jgi:hypothetical protein